MDQNEQTLALFTTRVRQMILQYKDMKKENSDLYATQLTQARNDYNSLKMAKMIEISDADMEGAQKRLAKLIRDVNKCITLLSEK